MNNRDLTLDFLKGVGILTVIIGHLSEFGRQFIFSFHMPLFFLISGYLFSQKPLSKSLHNDFYRLIVPYVFTSLVIIVFYFIATILTGQQFVLRWALASLWGSGAIHSSRIWGDLPYIGAIWFLLALFWCKNLFLVLAHNIKNIQILGCVCLVISLSSSFIDNNIISLPLAILPGCGAVIFFYAGYAIRAINLFKKINLKIAAILIGIWMCATFIPNRPFGMVTCDYTLWWLTIPGAVAAVLVLYIIFDKVLDNKYLLKLGGIIVWIGECSLVILCIHLIDLDIPIRRILGIKSSILAILFDVAFCLIGTVFLTQFNLTRKLLRIRKFHSDI